MNEDMSNADINRLVRFFCPCNFSPANCLVHRLSQVHRLEDLIDALILSVQVALVL